MTHTSQAPSPQGVPATSNNIAAPGAGRQVRRAVKPDADAEVLLEASVDLPADDAAPSADIAVAEASTPSTPSMEQTVVGAGTGMDVAASADGGAPSLSLMSVGLGALTLAGAAAAGGHGTTHSGAPVGTPTPTPTPVPTPTPTPSTGTGNDAINGNGSVTIGGLLPGAGWQFSTDGGQHWKPGTGNSIPAEQLAEGKNTITIVQIDKDGTRSEPALISVVKDTVATQPSVDTNTGTGAINNSGSVNVDGIEAGGKWDYSLDDGKTWTPGSGSSIPGGALSEGTNHVTVRQTDAAGNQSTQTVDVDKDSSAPAPDIKTSTGTGAINNSGSVNVDGIEAGGKWDYSLDDGKTWTPGSGSSIPGDALSEGSNHVTVRQTDVAGNQSTKTVDVVKDTQVAQAAIDTSTGTGAINNSGSVNVTGIEAGGKWDYSLDGGQTWTQGSGNAISGNALSEGTNHVTVRQTDAAGNQSTKTLDVVKDTQVAQAAIDTSTGTGAINNSGSVNVTGIEAGGKWDYSLNGGQTWTQGSGNAISGSALSDGTNHVTVRQTDAAGNQSTTTVDVVKDTQVAQADIGTSTGTGAINNAGWVTVGNIESGGRWDYSLDDGQTWTPGIGSSVAASALGEGINPLTVRHTDAAGNVASASIDVTKDSIAQNPTVTTSSGGTINGTGSVIIGGIEAGATWDYSLDSGQTWKPGSGSSIAASALGENTNLLTVRQTDALGNVGQTTMTVIKDTVAAAPTLALTTDSGDGGDRLTNDGRVSVAGIESGATWEYSIDGGAWVAGGQTGLIADPGFADGAHAVRARQTDAVGNASQETVLNFTIDKSAPATPVFSINNDSGVSGDLITNRADFGVSGIELGAALEIGVDGWRQFEIRNSSATSLLATMDGALSEGARSIVMWQVDKAGNASALSDTLNFTIDRTVAKPILTLANDTGASATDGLTSDASINVASLESGGKWDYSLDAGQTWTPGSGTSISGSALSEGTNHVTVRQTDLAGNVGVSSSLTVERDTQINQPVLTRSSGDGNGAYMGKGTSIGVSGLENGANWEWQVVTANGTSAWTKGEGDKISVEQLPQNTHLSLSVRTTDGAGNQAESAMTVYADTTPPTAALQQPSATEQAQIFSSEGGAYYLVRSDQVVDVSQGLGAISRLDPALWKSVASTAGYTAVDASGLADGSYRLYAGDLANLVEVTVGSTKVQAMLQVSNNGQATTTMVMGTAGNDILQAPDNGGLMVGNGGADRFVFKAGQTGTFVLTDIDNKMLNGLQDMDILDLSAVLKNYTFQPVGEHWVDEAFIKRVNENGKSTIFVDSDGQGDFGHADLVLVLTGSVTQQHVRLETPTGTALLG